MTTIKNDILTVSVFQENRPDMSSFNTNEIQSAIFQVSTFLDAKCNGLISEVWYITDPTNPLYRTDNEKNFIVEAFIQQAQYSLNIGNDWSVGSNSLSTGGLSGSFQRPVDRDEFAPGVQVLLQKARVYETFYGLSFGQQASVSPDQSINDYLTYSAGDTRYVGKFQASGVEGQVAVLNNASIVTFQDPSNVAWNTTNTLKIWDRATSMYVDIHDVQSLCFYGNNDYGYASGMSRGEIKNAIAIKNSLWNADAVYSLGVLVSQGFTTTEGKQVLAQFESLKPNNQGHEPSVSPEWWKFWESATVDMNKIIDESVRQLTQVFTPKFEEYELQTTTNLNTSFAEFTTKVNNDFASLSAESKIEFVALSGKVEQEVAAGVASIPLEINKQLNDLPSVNVDFYMKGQVLSFDSKAIATEFFISQGWVEGTDYKVVPNDLYLRAGESGVVSGKEFLVQSDLPNIVDNFTISNSSRVDLNACDASPNNKMLRVTGAISGQVGSVGIAGGSAIGKNFSLSLNGNVVQTKVEPLSQQIYTIIMLKTKSKLVTFISPPIKISWNDITGPWTDRQDLVDEFAKYASLIDFNALKAVVDTNTTNIATNVTNIATNKTNIATNTTNIATNTTDLTTIKANYVTTNTAQDITAIKAFYGALDLKTTNNFVFFRMYNKEGILIANYYKDSANNNVYYKVVDHLIFITGKTLRVRNTGSIGYKEDVVNVEYLNQRLADIPTPTTPTAAANKAYVDSKIPPITRSMNTTLYPGEVRLFFSEGERDTFVKDPVLKAKYTFDLFDLRVGAPFTFKCVRIIKELITE